MTHDTVLAAKIAARNHANRLANGWYEKMTEALKPFIGKQILKTDGTLLKKVKEALVNPINSRETLGHYETDNYTIMFRFKTSETSKERDWTPEHQYGHAQYADQTIYLGILNHGVLTGLQNAPTYKTDYTEEFIVETRKAVRQAEATLNQLQNSLYDFGMYDL